MVSERPVPSSELELGISILDVGELCSGWLGSEVPGSSLSTTVELVAVLSVVKLAGSGFVSIKVDSLLPTALESSSYVVKPVDSESSSITFDA